MVVGTPGANQRTASAGPAGTVCDHDRAPGADARPAGRGEVQGGCAAGQAITDLSEHAGCHVWPGECDGELVKERVGAVDADVVAGGRAHACPAAKTFLATTSMVALSCSLGLNSAISV